MWGRVAWLVRCQKNCSVLRRAWHNPWSLGKPVVCAEEAGNVVRQEGWATHWCVEKGLACWWRPIPTNPNGHAGEDRGSSPNNPSDHAGGDRESPPTNPSDHADEDRGSIPTSTNGHVKMSDSFIAWALRLTVAKDSSLEGMGTKESSFLP